MDIDFISAGFVAKYVNGELVGSEDSLLQSLSALHNASEKDISFARSKKEVSVVNSSSAGLVILSKNYKAIYNKSVIYTDNPYLSFAKLTKFFHQKYNKKNQSSLSKTAHISPSSNLSFNVSVGHFSFIGEDSVIGENTVIGNNCSIYKFVKIGANCIIDSNVVIYSGVVIGDNTTIHAGSIIGGDGFAFAENKEQWTPLYHLGGVEIGSNVRIGSGVTIDAGLLDSTFISDNVILDNQVHLAHNVFIGKGTAIAGCTGVAGSSSIGNNCKIGGMCAIGDHVDITNRVVLCGSSTVQSSISSSGVFSSCLHAMPFIAWKRSFLVFRKLGELIKRLVGLEKSVNRILKKNNGGS